MDRDRIEGAVRQAKGSLKEAVGKATGNNQLQVKGAAEKAEGKIQNAVGGVKDAIKATAN